MQNSPPTPSSDSPLRVFVFLIITLVSGSILLSLPLQLQRVLFGLMISVALIIAMPKGYPVVRKRVSTLQFINRHNPLRIARANFVIGLIFLGLSAFFYQPRYADNFIGFYLFLMSLPFIRLSFALIPVATPHAHADTAHANDVLRWHWIGVSIVCMTLLTMMNVPQSWTRGQPFYATLGLVSASPHSQMVLLCIGLVSVIHGFGGRLLPRRIIWQRHHTILLGIVLLGGGIRLWDLEYTLHMFVDEFYFLRDVIDLNTTPQQILYPNAAPTTDVFAYIQMQFVNLWGPSFTSFRFITPIISMLALVASYSLVRQLFSLRVALMSAFLLAVLPVYIHFGRIGMNMVVDPMIGMMGFMVFLRGLRHQRLSDFALAGVAFGLTHYFYEGGRIFFTLFLLCWLVWIAIFCRRDSLFRLPTVKQSAVFVFCLAIVTVPLYHTLWSHGRTFTQRLDATRSPESLLSERLSEFLLDNKIGHIGAPIQRYVQTAVYDNFYQSDDAYILPFLVPFFLLGFGILLWRIRTLHGSMFVWWALGVAIGNSLIFDVLSAPSPRHIVVYGVLMIITAVGIHALWSVLTEWFTGRWQRWLQVGFLIGLGCVGFYQVTYYFNTIVPNFRDTVFKARPAYDDMILRAVTLPENTTLHVFTDVPFSTNHRVDVPQFYGRLVPDDFSVKHTLIQRLIQEYFDELPRDRNHVFAFAQHDAPSVIAMIEKQFVITKIEGSSFDIPDSVELIFYHTSVPVCC